MTSLVLGDLTPESLTPSVNAHLDNLVILISYPKDILKNNLDILTCGQKSKKPNYISST
jgi:hypothetical protein